MDLPDQELAALASARDGRLASLLGPHALPTGGVRVVAWLPHASTAAVVLAEAGGLSIDMQALASDGLFAAMLPGGDTQPAYMLSTWTLHGDQAVFVDAYAIAPQISDLDLLTVAEGTNTRAFDVLGAHARTIAGVEGVSFAVWAPQARWVSVFGDFNDWDVRRLPMRRRGPGGIWELFVPGLKPGTRYKFHIESLLGSYSVDKSDPFAFQSELRPATASIVTDLDSYAWHDNAWMERRARSTGLDGPTTVYEVHPGSWRRAGDGDFLNYRELAHQLVDYVRDLGFTHVELMPVTEHPFDVSWGYQTTGYYAPTSRFGTPDDFMYFVDYCHQHDIGVFLDWVPSHFAKEGHGLGFFDGAHEYEHADPRQGEHLDWGTYVFNYGRGEVLTFLLSNAVYWLDRYHIDGMRVDAVASMLYLDHQRPAGAWVANRFGGRENLEAVEFLRRFNTLVHGEFPGVVTMAEESTSWPMVSRPTYLGGLGFTMKWNMGWMHDTLEYIKADPIYRRFIHNTITFSMFYNYSENFLLPLSHDEVVHGKSPLVYKAPGDDWQKFASLRLLLGYMWAHPGKKLLFMGGEFAQTVEWRYDQALEWHLLAHAAHQGARDWVRELNRLYAAHREFYELDYDPAGFQWIDCKDVDNSILIMMRRGKPDPETEAEEPALKEPDDPPEAHSTDPTGVMMARERARDAARAERIRRQDRTRPFTIVACNFTPRVRHGYAVGVPREGTYVEILNSDDRRFGGSGVINEGVFTAAPARIQEREHAITITLPPLGVAVFRLSPPDHPR